MPLDPVLDYDILVKAGIRGEISPYGTFVGYLGGVPYPEPKPTETYETYEVTIKSAKLTAQQITELLNVLPKNTTIEIKKG
jgi:hypothetical protein